jgi:hypothetical protein
MLRVVTPVERAWRIGIERCGIYRHGYIVAELKAAEP